MSSSNFNEMFKFISEYKYEISENAPNNLKCGKCKNILINAYCIPCGCSYCCDCVNEMMNNGVENCPGQTEYCKDELILNNHFDVRVNREISNVVIKCPEEMCSYKCAIINMEEHVRVCEKKSVKCPFANVGCDGKKISREMLNDHCQSANFNHCKILIELIDNMRNEIGALKANDEMNRLKIENLEKILKSKDEKNDKNNKEIELIKIEKETIKQEFDSFKQNVEIKLEGIDNKTKKENCRMEKNEEKRICDKINETLETKTKEIFVNLQNELLDQNKSMHIEKKSINLEINKISEMIDTRIMELNRIIDEIKFARIKWTIDKLDEKRNKGGRVESEYFTGVIKQYKLRLSFWADGQFGDIKGIGCRIYLCIWSGVNDQVLCWPFKADVTIKMISKTNPNINKCITKYCQIKKPANIYSCSEPFNYLYCDLTGDGEILDNCFIVECFIDFK